MVRFADRVPWEGDRYDLMFLGSRESTYSHLRSGAAFS